MSSRVMRSSFTAVIASVLGTTVYFSTKRAALQEKSIQQEREGVKVNKNGISLDEAIRKAEDLCLKIKEISGAPGLVVGVSIDGKLVYNKGFGYSDVENHVQCKSDTVMRIASISKSLTMAAVAQLLQNGTLSLDNPVQEYVPEFPEKFVDGEKAQITLRHLVSHLSGIRHYEKKSPFESAEENKSKSQGNESEFKNQEYLLNTFYESVSQSLTLFKDDELFSKPGTSFLYTTHGWTLVSAAVEGAVKTPFAKYMKSFFHDMGLRHTYLDENTPLIYNRSRYYVRNKNGRLENAPLVDNSYKWAGGGFLSTAEDLIKFGNAMLYSFQFTDGFLGRDSARMLWTPVEKTALSWDKDGQYGMGWGVVPSQANYPFCKNRKFYVSHTGGAIGASSVLLIYPRPNQLAKEDDSVSVTSSVQGVVVSMIVNLQNVGLNQTALEIAQTFDQVVD